MLRFGTKWTESNTFSIIISFLGLFLLLFFIFTTPAVPYTGKLILVSFILICVLGGLAALYPSQCAGIFIGKKEALSGKNESRMKGHHPDCEQFQEHILFISGERYCAGCTGLLLGALVAIFGILLYYLYPFSFNGKITVIIGAGTVFLSLFILFLNKAPAGVKFTANFFLVFGSLLILLGMINLKTGLIFQLYFLILILVWIASRSELSRKNHAQICGDCDLQADCEL